MGALQVLRNPGQFQQLPVQPLRDRVFRKDRAYLPAGIFCRTLCNFRGKLLAAQGARKGELDHIAGPDPPRSIEDGRAREAEMGEEEITGMLCDLLSSTPD